MRNRELLREVLADSTCSGARPYGVEDLLATDANLYGREFGVGVWDEREARMLATVWTLWGELEPRLVRERREA